MKWVFMLCVVLNAGVFAWHSYSPIRINDQEVAYAPPVSVPVYLLGEDAPLVETAPVVAVSVPAPSPAAIANQASEAASAALVSNNGAPQDLTQNNANQKATSQQAEADVMELGAAGVEALLCPFMEFERTSDRDAMLAILETHGIESTLSDARGQREKYWLYIPEQDSADKAKGVMAQLRLKKIDSYVIARGDMKNRISLGLFSSLERAIQAQNDVKQKTGYETSIYRHQRDVAIYRVELDAPILESVWLPIIDSIDVSKWLIKLEKNPC